MGMAGGEALNASHTCISMLSRRLPNGFRRLSRRYHFQGSGKLTGQCIRSVGCVSLWNHWNKALSLPDIPQIGRIWRYWPAYYPSMCVFHSKNKTPTATRKKPPVNWFLRGCSKHQNPPDWDFSMKNYFPRIGNSLLIVYAILLIITTILLIYFAIINPGSVDAGQVSPAKAPKSTALSCTNILETQLYICHKSNS